MKTLNFLPIKNTFTPQLESVLGGMHWFIISLLLAPVSGLFGMYKLGLGREVRGQQKSQETGKILIWSSGFSLIGVLRISQKYLSSLGTSGYNLTELEMLPSTWLAADKVRHPHLPLLELEIHPQAPSELFPSLLEESPLEWCHLKVVFPFHYSTIGIVEVAPHVASQLLISQLAQKSGTSPPCFPNRQGTSCVRGSHEPWSTP